MTTAQVLAAQREVFVVCPESREIFRLSEGVITFPGKLPVSPAEKIVRLRKRLDQEERNFEERLEAERESRARRGRLAAHRQVGKVYPFIDPKKVNPADVQVLFDPVLLVAFHGATDRRDDVEVEFIAKAPTTALEEQRIGSLRSAVRKSSFKIYRVNPETGQVEVSVPVEYKPRPRKH